MIIRRNSSSLRIVTALINIFAIAACNPDAMPGPVVSKGQILISTGQRSIHRPSTPSQVLASRIPEFGGAFIDERGILKVYLTNSSATLAARLLIQDQLRAQRRPQLRFQFIPGTYSYARLESFIEVLLPFLGPSGTAYVWIDERRNRLRIGVATQIARARLTGAITQLNIPLGAIIIEDAKYPVALSQRNLNDQVRPLLGGLEVGVIGRPGTLAAIVKLQGQTYALVSSHVADPTGNGGIGYETKQNAFTTRIGTVAVNPAFTSSPNGCPTGGRCRYSDAALVLLDTGASYSFSSIAAPIGGPSYTGEGPRDFDTAAPMQLASDPVSCPNNSPCTIDWYPGDSATKVGKTTGWTGGKYIGMATYIQAVDGLYRLENILVEGLALGGDSGAPIVSKARDKISGILWGGDIVIDGKNAFIGSYWANISTELGGTPYSLHTVDPRLLGYEQHVRHDGACPDNPDAFNFYLINGYPDGAGSYETTSSQNVGYSTYLCGDHYVQGTFANNSSWQACEAQFVFGCPCALDIVGGSCHTFDP